MHSDTDPLPASESPDFYLGSLTLVWGCTRHQLKKEKVDFGFSAEHSPLGVGPCVDVLTHSAVPEHILCPRDCARCCNYKDEDTALSHGSGL